MPTQGVTKSNEPLSTYSGEYYVGMRKEEAIKKGIYEKRIGIDFKDIDTTRDGILQDFEIKKARDQEAKRSIFVGVETMLVGAIVCGVSGVVEIGSGGLATPAVVAMDVAAYSMMSTGLTTASNGLYESFNAYDNDGKNSLRTYVNKGVNWVKSVFDK